jgi:hypothetical protein
VGAGGRKIYLKMEMERETEHSISLASFKLGPAQYNTSQIDRYILHTNDD